MITIKQDVDLTYTATVNTLIQNTTGEPVKYATDNTETQWLVLYPRSIPIQVLAGDTVYFRSGSSTTLAEMPML